MGTKVGKMRRELHKGRTVNTRGPETVKAEMAETAANTAHKRKISSANVHSASARCFEKARRGGGMNPIRRGKKRK